MTRIIQPEIEFVNEKLQQLLDSDRSFGLEGGTSVHFRSPVSVSSLSSVSAFPRLPVAAPVAFPPQPEYEGGFNPHNQPRGFVARPTAAIHSKNTLPAICKPVTIASRVRAIYARVRVSRWLAWIAYLMQGEESYE